MTQLIRRKAVSTRRLILRPFHAKDYKAWYNAYYAHASPAQDAWDSDPKDKKTCTPARFKRLMKRLNELARKDDYYRYGVFDKASGTLVGEIDFDIYVRSTHQFANFGYRIFNTHWGKGFGKEAAAAGLKIGFQQLKLNRLEAAIHPANRKSIRLAQAIGMQREGIKKRYWFEHGRWTDHLIYVANPEDIGLKPGKPG